MSAAVPLDPRVLAAHVAGARSLARALLHDPDAADDAVQEACVVALTKPPRAGWDFRAWFSGVVRNKAREQRRALARRAGALADEPPGRAAEPDLAERMETQRRLFAAVLALPETYRTVVWLRHFEDLPPRAIAARLVVPVETVRTRHRRAMDLLREALGGASGPEAKRWALALLPLAAPGGAGGTGAFGNGGLLMTLGGKTAVGLGAAALLVAGLLLWRANERNDVPSSAPREAADARATSAPTLAGRASPAGPPGHAAVAEDPTRTWIVAGRVLDEDNAPLADAEVLWGGPEALDVARLTPLARSGPDGRFRAPIPLDALRIRLVARAPGRRPTPGAASRGGGDVELRLFRLRELNLRVLDADTGAPLAGVTCEAVIADKGNEVLLSAVAGPDGRVSVPDTEATGIDFQPASVRLVKAGYAPLKSLPRQSVQSRGKSADRPLDVYLRRGAGLRVRVIDEAGHPVVGAEVLGWTGRGNLLWDAGFGQVGSMGFPSVAGEIALGRVTSDEAGHVTLSVPGEGEPWAVLATRGSEVGAAWDQDASTSRAPMDVVLHPAYDITGKVVDESGRALAGAWVRFEWEDVTSRSRTAGSHALPASLELDRRRQVVTDADGRYRLVAVPLRGDGAEQWLYANHADSHARERLSAPASGKGPVELDLTLKPVGEPVRVKVVDAQSGAPIAEAAVTWDHVVPTTPTDIDGIAVRARHPTGTMSIEVRARGYVPYRGDGPPATNEVEVRLERARTLAGQVLDSDGNPVSAHVDVFRPEVAALPDEERAKRQVYGEGWLGRDESGALGAFRVEGLPPGPLFVRAWVRRSDAKGLRFPMLERVLAEGEAAEFRLPADQLGEETGQELAGAVYAADGRRITRYRIALEGPGRYTWAEQTGWEFRFTGIWPGAYALIVFTDEGTQRGRLPVVVRAGQDLEGLRVVVGDLATLTGKLVPPPDASDADLRGLWLVAEHDPRSQSSQGAAQTRAGGTFQIDRLEPGAYVVSVRAQRGDRGRWQVRDGRVEIPAGASTHDFALVPAGGLVLGFEDERFDGNPVVEMERFNDPKVQAAFQTEVRVRGADGVVLKGNGLFRGRHAREWVLLPGTYELEIESQTFGSFRSTFRVTGGEDTTVEVVLAK